MNPIISNLTISGTTISEVNKFWRGHSISNPIISNLTISDTTISDTTISGTTIQVQQFRYNNFVNLKPFENDRSTLF